MLSINHESMFHEANGFFAEGFYSDDMKFQPRDKTYKYNSSPLIVIKHMNYESIDKKIVHMLHTTDTFKSSGNAMINICRFE